MENKKRRSKEPKEEPEGRPGGPGDLATAWGSSPPSALLRVLGPHGLPSGYSFDSLEQALLSTVSDSDNDSVSLHTCTLNPFKKLQTSCQDNPSSFAKGECGAVRITLRAWRVMSVELSG